MRTLDKFYTLLNENKPFEFIDTDIEVWRKVEEIIGVTRQLGDAESEEELMAAEKLLLRAIISYLTKYQKEADRNYTTVCDILRTNVYPHEVEPDKTEMDSLFESLAQNEELDGANSFCYNQYLGYRLNRHRHLATSCLLNRLAVLEILENEKRNRTEMNEEKIIVE